ncbi:Hypothetical protein A7982_02155 [Minicystis rosea]|nr:Hypothetical protein A7982_02155 [Minicystis rosea]
MAHSADASPPCRVAKITEIKRKTKLFTTRNLPETAQDDPDGPRSRLQRLDAPDDRSAFLELESL